MSGIKLGVRLNRSAERDAVHVAIYATRAGEDLYPGQRVVVSEATSLAYPSEVGLGIVDPFLTGRVEKGGWFWVLLMPGIVSNLRHHWTHPSIDTCEAEDDDGDMWEGCQDC